MMAAYAVYKRRLADLRAKASMGHFERMRRLFNDAGVSIYAFKPTTFEADNTDAEVDYGMRAAKTLGADQVNVEIPTDPAQIARLAAAATRHGLHVGYHAHLQATPTLWDAALAESPANYMNLDLGWYVAAGAADPIGLMRRYHARIDSIHLKDRQNLASRGARFPLGSGRHSVVRGAAVDAGSALRVSGRDRARVRHPGRINVIKEIGKCLDYCRRALAS